MRCFSSIVKAIFDALVTSKGRKVRYELKTPFRKGTTHVAILILQFIRQIVSPGVERRTVVKDLAIAESWVSESGSL